MTLLPKADMAEATRLTRLGRVAEAMAVLKGGLGRSGSVAAEPAPEVLDLEPPSADGGAWALPKSEKDGKKRPGPSFVSDPLRAFGGRRQAAQIAPGARFEEKSFANATGSRAYKLYVPSGYRGQAVPLVVMLHGCTQSPDDFAAGTGMNALAEEHLFLVAYPAQPQSANASKCWNWFNAGDQQRDKGEPSLIAGVTRQVMADFAIDESRIYIAGLSAGGAAAAIMGSAYPDLYAAVGVHSGLACGAAKDMPSAFTAMSRGAAGPARRRGDRLVPTIVFHGDGDRTVSPINGDHVIAQSRGDVRLRSIESHGTSKGGVSYRRTVLVDETDRPVLEQWRVQGAGHAWAGGGAAGSYTDPKGPDASREMVRFFLQHRLAPEASVSGAL